MNERLSPEMEAKYAGTPWVRMYRGGHGNEYLIPNRGEVDRMPLEVYQDLISGPAIGPWKKTDPKPRAICPEGMQVFTWRARSKTLGFFFVDAQIEITDEDWFDLDAVLWQSPWCWPTAMRSRYPNASATSFIPLL